MSNNTSAANSFPTQSNGNLGASNISKVNVHSLLYSGASTKVFAHLVLWFGQSSHMNVGYSSVDPVQVARQVNDMISRGIDGIVMVWYGPNNFIDHAAQLVMKEAENHPGFTFAIMIDHGAILWDSCPGCSPQQALTAQMQYLEQTYFSSPAYLRLNGQPVVTNFDIDLFYQINWNAVSSALSSQPTFIFQNNGGFTHVLSGGAYSWVMPTASNFGLNYLSSFYSTGAAHPNLEVLGASYKGFNDTSASWSLNRVMPQQCGQTWLQTFGAVNSFYSPSRQLPILQLVTWNDYEEGSEIESGIDNCVNLNASQSAGNLQWTVTGNEQTVDHYTVYVSSDGQNLMSLADLPTGYHSLDLCGYGLGSGQYSVFVQAVGRPNLTNHISGPVSYNAACGGSSSAPSPPPSPAPGPRAPQSSFTLNASPGSISTALGQSVSSQILITPQTGAYNQPITLSCANLPAWMSCRFSPSAVTPGSSNAGSVLRISTTAISPLPPGRRPEPVQRSASVPTVAPQNSYSLAIKGTSGSLQATTYLTVRLQVRKTRK
ncbi:MAG: hypothetical protein JOZ14_07495 [Acidobacteria bacterium]|nr:hypothetical protein [Acidobacteriota bacterium]